jgi:tetratricopeptide (TPR) repeat protein
MDLLAILKIVLIVGPLLITIYFWIQPLPIRTKIILSIICIPVLIAGVWLPLQETAEKKKQEEADTYDRGLSERTVLLLKGKPETYIDGLGETPLLKHFFNEGQRCENEYRFKEAIEEYSKCLSHPGAAAENKVAANILIGNCYYAQSKFGEAEKHYREALDNSKGVKDKIEKLKAKAFALGNIGLVLFQKGDLEGALENDRKSLEINKKIDRPEGIANNCGNIGIVLHQKGDLDGALESYRKVLDIEQKLGRPHSIANAYGNIGSVLREKGDLEGALENHRKALKMDEKIGNPLGMAQDYGNIGLVLADKGDLEGALENHRKALEIDERIGNPSAMARDYGNIGNVLYQKGDLDGALEKHEKALNIFKELGQPAGEAQTYMNIANIRFKKNKYKAAAILQLQALRIYSQIGMKPDVQKAQRHLRVSIAELKEQGKYEDFLQEAKQRFGEEVEKLLGGLFTADEAD